MSKRFLLRAIATAACASPCMGAPAATVSLAGLLRQSDAVVVGAVSGVSVSGPDVIVALSITRALVGSLNAGEAVSGVWTPGEAPNILRPTSDVGASGIWFLKQQNDKSWSVLPIEAGTGLLRGVYFPVPPGQLPPAYAYPASAEPQAKFAWEAAAGAADSGSGPSASRILASGALDGLGPAILTPCGRLWPPHRPPSRDPWVFQVKSGLALRQHFQLSRIHRPCSLLPTLKVF